MKTFVGAMVLFLILAGGIITYGVYMEKNKQDFSDLISKTESAVLTEDFGKAEKSISEIEKKWGKTKNLLMAFCDHQDLVAIEEHLKNIKNAVKYQNSEEASKETEIFKIFLMYAYEGTTPTLTNIL